MAFSMDLWWTGLKYLESLLSRYTLIYFLEGIKQLVRFSFDYPIVKVLSYKEIFLIAEILCSRSDSQLLKGIYS